MDGPNKFLNVLGSNYMNSSHIDRVIQWMLEHQSELPIFFLAIRGRPDVTEVNKQLPVTELVDRFKNAASASPADTITEFKKICLVLGFIPPLFYLADKNGTVPSGFEENIAKGKKNELYSEAAMKRFQKIKTLLDKQAYDKLAKNSLLSQDQWQRMGAQLIKFAKHTEEVAAAKASIDEAEAKQSNLEALLEQTNKKKQALLKSAKEAQSSCRSDPSDSNKAVFAKLKKELKKIKNVSSKLEQQLQTLSESIKTLSLVQQPVHGPKDVLFADPFEADVFVTDLFYKTQSSKGSFTKRYRRFNNRLQNSLLKVLQDLNASNQKPAEYSEALVAVRDLALKSSDRIHTQMARDFAANAATQLFRCENDPEFAVFPVLPVRNLINSNIYAGKEDLAAQKKKKNAKTTSEGKKGGSTAAGNASGNEDQVDAEIDALLADDSFSDDPADGDESADGKDEESNNFSLSLSDLEEGGEEEEEEGEEEEKEGEEEKIETSTPVEPKVGKKRKREEEEPEKKESPSTPAKKRAKKEDIPVVAAEESEKKKKEDKRKPAKKRERKEEKEEANDPAPVPVEDVPLKKRGKKSGKKSTPTRKSPPPIKTDDVSFEDFYENVLEHYGFENKDDLIETPKNGTQIDAIESALLAIEHEDYHRIFHEPFPKLTLTPTRDDRDSALTAIRQRGVPHTIRPSTLLQCGHVALHLNRIPRSIAVSIRDNAKVTEENYEDALVEYLHSTEGICNLSTALLQIEDSVNILTSYYGQAGGSYQLV